MAFPHVFANLSAGNQPASYFDDNFNAIGVSETARTTLATVVGTNTITGTLTPVLAAYVAGQIFSFVPTNTNTGATTLNISSLGAKNVYFGNAALTGGEIQQNVPCYVFYDGTQFQIIGPFVAGTLLGSLKFSTAASKIIPGATSLSLRNNADNADNVLITDAGIVTIRAGLTVTAGNVNVTAGDFAINTNKFTVANATGNTLVAGTFQATGIAGFGAAGIAGNQLYVTISGAGATAGRFDTDTAASNPITAYNKAASGDNIFENFYTEASATLRGSIDYNRAGGLTRYNTTSDRTLKTLLGDAPVAPSLDILRNVRMHEYYWTADPNKKPQVGPFAQEVYEMGFHGAVSVGGEYQEKTTDEDGNEVSVTKYRPWALDRTAFVNHLVIGWQDHEARLKALTAALTKAGLMQ